MPFAWQDHHFISGRLCLDLVNTVVYAHDPGRREDRLPDLGEMLGWLAAAPHVPDFCIPKGYDGIRFHLDALQVRSACDHVFRAAALGGAIEAAAWAELAAMHSASAGGLGMAATADGLAPASVGTAASAILGAITFDALSLALSPRLARVRECPGCNWLFVDGTRNGGKRWCEMRTCGNRAKARRHGARKRLESTDI